MWFVFFKQLFSLLSFIRTWSNSGAHQKPLRCQPCSQTSKIMSYINLFFTKCLDLGTCDNNKKQAKGLTEVILQNGCSRRVWEKEGSEPENTQRSSCFWKTQTVSAQASARRVFGASGRHVGLPRGTGRANGGNNVTDTVGDAAGS